MTSFKNRMFLLTLLIAGLILNGCSKDEPADPMSIETFQMVPSSDDVEDYLELLEEYEEETDQWFQVTSKEIRDKYDIVSLSRIRPAVVYYYMKVSCIHWEHVLAVMESHPLPWPI